MDTGQVLRCVSESLRTLIRDHIPELQPESAVVFDSPAEISSQGETKLSLYLYQLDINPYLRNLPPQITRFAGASRTPASLRVIAPPLVADLLYMLVPYARSAELELVLIEKLVGLFHDIPQLAGPGLHPVLKQSGNAMIPIIPTACTPERLHNIWSGFPGKPYKFTRLYTVSPVRIPSGTVWQSDMVTEGELTAVLTNPLKIQVPS